MGYIMEALPADSGEHNRGPLIFPTAIKVIISPHESLSQGLLHHLVLIDPISAKSLRSYISSLRCPRTTNRLLGAVQKSQADWFGISGSTSSFRLGFLGCRSGTATMTVFLISCFDESFSSILSMKKSTCFPRSSISYGFLNNP